MSFTPRRNHVKIYPTYQTTNNNLRFFYLPSLKHAFELPTLACLKHNKALISAASTIYFSRQKTSPFLNYMHGPCLVCCFIQMGSHSLIAFSTHGVEVDVFSYRNLEMILNFECIETKLTVFDLELYIEKFMLCFASSLDSD